MRTFAIVTFKDGSSQTLTSNKSPMTLALDDIKEQLVVESDFWFKNWYNISISIERS